MKLRVLNIAFPLLPVKKDAAGSAEQILLILDKALVENGHFSVVIASKGSKVNGKLIESTGTESYDDLSIKMIREQHKILIEHVLERWEFDIIHMHGIDFDTYLPPAGLPVLVTLHLPIDWYNKNLLYSQIPWTYFNCVSKLQHDTCITPDGQNIPNLVPYIENGIDTENFIFKKNKENFALTLGRICPEKGYHLAIEAAKLAGISLILTGPILAYQDHQKYFENEVLPLLDDNKYKFIDHVGFDKKKDLLSSAKCLLITSLIPEASSLAAMEALASGTPVIAFPAGALNEIIEHGKNGFIVQNQFEMAEAISRINSIENEYCRESVIKRFHSSRMIKGYFNLYQRIINRSKVKPKIYY